MHRVAQSLICPFFALPFTVRARPWRYINYFSNCLAHRPQDRETPCGRNAKMLEQAAFDVLIGRIRAGDEQAAAELVRLYEPLIRREVRLRIRDRRLMRLFESGDVSQSVLGSFFARTALGEYDLETPAHLVKLLVAMTRNKVATAAQRQHRQRRDYRRTGGAADLDRVADPGPSPSELFSGKELLERFRAGLTDEERRIADLRKDGLGWVEITSEIGGTPQARRMQLARAIERVARQIDPDEQHA